jgi:glycolate oxidase FAD binding subunit
MNIVDRAKQVLGERLVVPEGAPVGMNIVQPADLSAAAELVQLASRNDWKLVPIGSGSKLHWTGGAGVPPAEAGRMPAPHHAEAGRMPAPHVLYMSMRLCARVIEYEPEDMTLTAESGITLAGLADVLSRRKQRVTLDPPYASRATLGGVLAANDSGPTRFAYGTASVAVIGLSMIHAEVWKIKWVF